MKHCLNRGESEKYEKEGSAYWPRFWRCMQLWPGEWTTVYHPICSGCHLPMPWGGAWLEDTERVTLSSISWMPIAATPVALRTWSKVRLSRLYATRVHASC